MYIQNKSNAFFVVIFLSLVVLFLYSLGLIHSFACSSQNQVLLSILGFIDNMMSISYGLGTKALSTYMPLTNCSF